MLTVENHIYSFAIISQAKMKLKETRLAISLVGRKTNRFCKVHVDCICFSGVLLLRFYGDNVPRM